MLAPQLGGTIAIVASCPLASAAEFDTTDTRVSDTHVIATRLIQVASSGAQQRTKVWIPS